MRSSNNILRTGYLSDLKYNKSVVIDVSLEEAVAYAKSFNIKYETHKSVDTLRERVKDLKEGNMCEHIKLIVTGYVIVKLETDCLKDLVNISKVKNVNLIVTK